MSCLCWFFDGKCDVNLSFEGGFVEFNGVSIPCQNRPSRLKLKGKHYLVMF